MNDEQQLRIILGALILGLIPVLLAPFLVDLIANCFCTKKFSLFWDFKYSRTLINTLSIDILFWVNSSYTNPLLNETTKLPWPLWSNDCIYALPVK